MQTKKVFVASPSDCSRDRKIAREVISELSARMESDHGIRLEPVLWEDMAPIYDPNNLSPWQDRIDREMRTCDIFVGILYREYGTPIRAFNNLSGTHYEFMQAIAKAPGMKIMTYYKVPKTKERQGLKMTMLKKYLASAKVPYQKYTTSREFRERFEADLEQAFDRTMEGRQRKKNLKSIIRYDSGANAGNFFKIVYPPIHQTSQGRHQRRIDWKQRLMPDVVFEDFKAIEKISSAVSLIGCAYEVETSDISGAEHFEGNAIWLCLPRNELAQMHLKNIRSNGKRSVRFRFEDTVQDKNKATERTIFWEDADGKELSVRSPLSRYLAKQRRGALGMWNIDLANIYARDYAVIARFKRGTPYSNQPYYHYFIAGIRGLGTWGAGSCFGRWHNVLAGALTGDDDFQVLVQVSYDRCKIHKVRVVSGEDQAYFDSEMQDDTIERRIRDHDHLLVGEATG